MSTDSDAATAGGVARHVSRLLRSASLPMADTSDRYQWTEGFHVHRIGYSGHVSVSYHVPHYACLTDEQRERRKSAETRAREVLSAAGYVQDDHGTIDASIGRKANQ